ncbi:MAG: class I SAM-dependent methyltransferase [Pseudomonadota bacterium]
MTEKSAKDLLEGAYALQTPTDNVNYYADFAAIYDDGYVADMGYQSPRFIAQYLQEVVADKGLKIADIGCGTGLIADHLTGHHIDGYDISPQMIEVARRKNLYRDFFCADLTGDLSGLPKDYDALVSAGTFTLGHLNADHLLNLTTLLKPAAWVAITISHAHFDKTDFEEKLQRAVERDQISTPEYRAFSIYSKTDHTHSSDKGWLTRFQTR